MKSWLATANLINRMAISGTPFLFAFDFDGYESFALPLNQIDPEKIRYNIAGITNDTGIQEQLPSSLYFECETFDFALYQRAFNKVQYHLRRGDSYLLNLTFPVGLRTNLTTSGIYQIAKAPYKLWVKDRFVVFSPESFVSILDNHIHTYPMKGTINAQLPDAADLLLSNKKELAEHYTIVDLLRNDLSMIAQEVRVERFRYLDTIHTLNGKLLQTSSHITGRLPSNWIQNLGNTLLKLLPAGSVSGAPKRRTVEIIHEAETDSRGFYTGVMGVFDGAQLHSAVMIRFVEQQGDKHFFRAGGGITVNSQCRQEYDELLHKAVLPFQQASVDQV